MTEANDKAPKLDTPRKLADAIRDVKNANADRDDVVIEMREAERMRLELLAAELAPVIADVPEDSDLFDFAISSGMQPRFWIDAVAHVSMGRDKRTFRFVRDTRLGRVVLAESTDMKTVANQVTRYLAERIVERQRLIEGDVVEHRGNVRPIQRTVSEGTAPTPVGVETAHPADAAGETATGSASLDNQTSLRKFLGGSALVVAGIAAGLAVAAALYWDQLDLGPLMSRFTS